MTKREPSHRDSPSSNVERVQWPTMSQRSIKISKTWKKSPTARNSYVEITQRKLHVVMWVIFTFDKLQIYINLLWCGCSRDWRNLFLKTKIQEFVGSFRNLMANICVPATQINRDYVNWYVLVGFQLADKSYLDPEITGRTWIFGHRRMAVGRGGWRRSSGGGGA